MYCKFRYQYRDGSNYKISGEVMLRGQATTADEDAIRKACVDGLYFVAEKVGIPSVREALFMYSGGPTEDDVPWHEFIALESLRTLPQNANHDELVHLDDLVARFHQMARQNTKNLS